MESEEKDNIWLHISDIMSVLMMIFLFISVSYMISVSREQERMKDIVNAYVSCQDSLYIELGAEFKDDFKKWNATLNREDLSIRFQEPDVLFQVGESYINDKFKIILNDFFPRYIQLLSSDKYRDNIEEIRIEGHTSSEWNDITGDVAYINNMKLSQDRTREVLVYCLSITDKTIGDWAKSKLTANGLSSSKLIISNGLEDKEKSRRVEFRVRTRAEKVVNDIIRK